MRRIIALVLVVLFSMQTTASAAVSGSTQGPNIQPLLAAIENSFVFALLTGQEQRYNEAHAAAPQRLALNRVDTHPEMNRPRIVGVDRYGQPGRAPAMSSRLFLPKDAPRDPLAMRKSSPPIAMIASTSVPKPMSTCPQIITRARPMLCGQPTPTPLRTPTPTPIPTPTPTPVPTPTPTPVPTPTPTPVPTPTSTPTPIPVTPTPVPTATPVPPALPASNTGIKPWWTYEEKSLAGVGKALVNVGNGNMIVQAGDLDIHERGVDLAFGRTYNSQSQHDAAGTDGATPSVFGNGWTNTFDAHIAYNAALNIYSIYDVDGARYDYTSNGSGGWNPPPGMQGTTLIWDGCDGYQWTKKTGVIYYFWQPQLGCGSNASNAGYQGRLYEIFGRNHQNSIMFNYAWVGGNSSSVQNIAMIVAAHSDGNALVMTFGQFGPYTELASIACGSTTQPLCTSQKVTYSYDTSGNLVSVTRPGNATDDATRSQTITSLTEGYWYWSGTHEMQWVEGPRYMAGSSNGGGTSTDGSAYEFTYSANTTSGQLTWISDMGLVNFVPADGTNAALQSGSTNPNVFWRQAEFVYTSGETQLTDTDGHVTRWWYDGGSRVTSAAGYTGSGTNWLVTQATWDASNDLTASVDVRNNETDYAYDANGNMIAVAQPAVATSVGTFRPTALFSYDQFNNLTVYCDPIQSNKYGGDWIGSNPGHPYATGDNLCGAIAGSMYFTYSYTDGSEPYGLPTNSFTPSGYETTLAYNNGPVSDNYGLPTQITGAGYTQADGTTRTPTTTYTYDPYGDVASVNKGNGASTFTYDGLNRLTTTTDADNHTSYRYYNADGSVSKTEDPYQHANGWGSTTSYDPDGNALSATTYRMTAYNSTPAQQTTSDWYDGEDRLVEVRQPQDAANDLYQNPWTTRYIYDLSQDNSGGVSIGSSAGFLAHGNLYKTQELLPNGEPATVSGPAPLSASNTAFQDVNGNAFDALDRPIARYTYVAQNSTSAATLVQEQLTYDVSSYFTGNFTGQLTEDCNSAQPAQCSWFNYDVRSAPIQAHFSDTLSPDRSSTYDPDGRTASITSAAFGTEYYGYSVDGLLTSEQEAQGGGVTSPATFTHEYYPDDEVKQLDVASAALNQTGLFVYSRRPDGRVQTQTIDYGAQANVGSTSVAFTYTAAGRLSGRSESGPGANSSPTSITYDAYGRLSQENFPTCPSCGVQPVNPPLSSLVWDPQGQLMQTAFQTFNYTVRGEALGPANASLLANGVRIPKSVTVSGNTFPEQTIWNGASGALLTSTYSGTDCCGNSYDGNTTATYDTAGRMLTSSSGSDFEPGLASNQAESSTSGTITRSYDDENHTLSTTVVNTGVSIVPPLRGAIALYQWGVSGHPVLVGGAANTTATVPPASSAKYDTLHWDGDQLIFTTNASGQLDDIKVGASGDITPLDPSFTGLTFYDRGPDGSIMYCHNASGVTGRGAVDPYVTATPCIGGTITSTTGYTFYMPTTVLGTSMAAPTKQPSTLTVGSGGVVGMPRTDGFTDGINVIQGVRTYDGNTGQWTTPDKYHGSVDDPVSQKAYLWNGGNPFENGDPSGFVVGGYDHDPLTGMLEADPATGQPTDLGLWHNGGLLSLVPGNPNDLSVAVSSDPADACPTGCSGLKTIITVYSPTAALARQIADDQTLLRAWTMFLAIGSGFIGGPEGAFAGEAGGAGRLVTVVHYTNEAGAAAIRSSGFIRAGSFVTLPSEIPGGAGAAEIEALLEIGAGKGARSFTFQVPESQLLIPANGAKTSGEALQFQLSQPFMLNP